jgi:adenylate cyclase
MSSIKNALSRGRGALGLRQPNARQVRLAAGLVLFTYVATHYLNHSIANISVAAAESGLVIQKLVWQSLPGAVILYAALVTHLGLGFWALYERRSFRFTRAEATQLVLGLCIPALIADHVLGTRVSLSLYEPYPVRHRHSCRDGNRW